MSSKLFASEIFMMRDKLVRQQQEYREACDEDYKRGYSPHYCIHGTNMWTDYDNICGRCEDGLFTEYTSGIDLLRYARDEVAIYYDRVRQIVLKRTELVNALTVAGVEPHLIHKVMASASPHMPRWRPWED